MNEEKTMEQSGSSRVGGLFTVQNVVTAVAVVVVAWLTLLPIGFMIGETLIEAGQFSLDAFRRAFSNDIVILIVNTLIFAIGASALSLVIGTTLAFITERTDAPFRTLLFAASLVPVIVPGILYTISWIFLASPRTGLLNQAVAPVLGSGVFDIFTMGGMILIQGLSNSPLVYLMMVAAFRASDPSLEESAAMSGASLGQTIRRVSLPLVKPGLFSAALVMLVLNIEAFEVPALVGIPGGVWVLTSRIWSTLNQYPTDFGQAGAYAICLLVITAVGVYFSNRMSGGSRRYQTVTGKGFRPRRIPLRRWRIPVSIIVLVYFVVTLALPMLMLFYVSMLPGYVVPSADSLTSMTFDNYLYVMQHRTARTAFTNSLVLSIGTATIVMLLTAVCAWIVLRSRARGRWLLDNLTFLPLIIPGLVLGVALIALYLRIPIQVYGTLWILLIAYCTRFLPYGMRYATTSMSQIGIELEESAVMSGASWWASFRRVVLPLLLPGLIAGWLYIVMTSIRELSSSILLYSPGNEVLSVLIWEFWNDGRFGELAALGVLMIVVLTVVLTIARLVSGRFGVVGPR